MTKKILILYGYDKIFAYSSIKRGFSGPMNTTIMRERFESYGYYVEVSTFSELDLTRDFTGWFVLYASSEEKGLFYKDYIEDVLLSIRMRGGYLLPDFKYFRAHHNKSFAEMLRLNFKSNELKTILSRSFGSYKELNDNVTHKIEYPVVIKSSSGSGSYGVKLAKNKEELIKNTKKLNKIIYYDFYFNVIAFNPIMVRLRNITKKITGRQASKYSPLYSNKFIVQNYVKGFKGDYKVLVFADKFFVLRRENRDGSFTASGSGKSVFPTEANEIIDVLDFAELTHKELGTPVSSIDSGRNRDGCHLSQL